MDDEEQHQHQLLHLDIENLKVLSVLGRGAKGVVFLVRKGSGSTDGELLALKVVSKAFLIQKKNNKADKNDGHGDINGSEYKRICFERDVLRQFQHPLLPKLRGVFDTSSVVGYAIDYCPGRNLNSLRKKQTEHMFSDDIIRFYAAELVLALEYLHGLGIVYRDLKPENIMIQENGHLMLVDFDLSTKLSPKSLQTTPIHVHGSAAAVAKVEQIKRNRLTSFFKCGNSGILPDDSSSLADSVRTESDSVCKSNSFVGTEEYVAPEIILGSGHDFAVDWWSLGVVLYEMLYGVTPFRGENRKETFYRILAKTPELVGETTPLRDLIAKLLEKDPKQRISVEGIKGHDFFRGMEWNSVVRISRPPYIPCVLTVENEEDMDGIKEVNVELFVHGIFGQIEENNTTTNANKNTTTSINTHDTVNKGVWVEGLDNNSENDNFLVF